MSHGIPNLVDEMLRYPDELRRAYAILASREQPATVTPRQRETLNAIQKLTIEKGDAPTLEEIGSVLGTGRSNVCRLIDGLEERGVVVRKRGLARSIVIVEGRS